MNEIILEGKNITRSFGKLLAVNNVDFQINKGEIFSLIGPNGAGKTTLINTITNVYPAQKGFIKFMGKKINHLPPYKIAKLGIARTYQVTKPFLNMTVKGNVMIGAMFGREGSHTMHEINKEAEKWLDFVNLRDKKDIPIQSINIVDRKRTDLAKALATSPKLLFIDELMAGLNTKNIEELMDLTKKINQLGITILFVEHVMKAVMGISHRIMVLHHGEKIVEGLPEKVMENEKVLQAYLGQRRTKRKERT